MSIHRNRCTLKHCSNLQMPLNCFWLHGMCFSLPRELLSTLDKPTVIPTFPFFITEIHECLRWADRCGDWSRISEMGHTALAALSVTHTPTHVPSMSRPQLKNQQIFAFTGPLTPRWLELSCPQASLAESKLIKGIATPTFWEIYLFSDLPRLRDVHFNLNLF